MDKARKIELFEAFKHASVLYRLTNNTSMKGMPYRTFFQYLIDHKLMDNTRTAAHVVMWEFLMEFSSGLKILNYTNFNTTRPIWDEVDDISSWYFPFDGWFVRPNHIDLSLTDLESILETRADSVAIMMSITRKHRS